jgi:hypothetical protein
MNRYEKYLDLPNLIGRSRVSAFNGIKGRICDKIHGCKGNFLSQTGKEVLLKAVIQTIPTYTISAFQLPKTLCRDINSMMTKFWWGHKQNDKRIAWMNWSKLGRAKEWGGMGYKDLEWFNMALLAKQGWRLVQNPGGLVVTVLAEQYYPHGNFMEACLSKRPSYVWRSIWNSQKLLAMGLAWKVGDGSKISIWQDKWVRMGTGFIYTSVRILLHDAKVSALLDKDTNRWDTELVQQIFVAEEAESICGMAVSPRSGEDRRVWTGTHNGIFSV